MKLRITTILILIFSVIASHAQDRADNKLIKGFSGGMMVHSGYLKGGDIPAGELPTIGEFNPKGATFGIGGVAKIHLTKHFRTGFEGYFSTMGLKKDLAEGSHNKVLFIRSKTT